ncbi:mRNA interferase HigB [Rhodovulum sp. ES.010]|uniref:type II toxin-antitoxin system HigB family toxin n=1 Tax=Rhodovulum sp. ES.010 TaxID=1882821 RepID=UPI000925F915|nr:type II toxin-antitoxin system HigB family toxin [Rhodovulum sp. ES.010]SIO35270.1 mRNA interferase HigB [Rhodovulum sp. ES.010]
MRIVSRKALTAFGKRFPDARGQLDAWFHEVKRADWSDFHDVKEKYGSASPLKGGRAVFNICGNKYRIVVMINFTVKVVLIRFVGTHAEYDKINVEDI